MPVGVAPTAVGPNCLDRGIPTAVYVYVQAVMGIPCQYG